MRGFQFRSSLCGRRNEAPLVPRVCGVRTTHEVKRLGFVCSILIFLSPRRVSLFSCGVIFTCARISLALLSLRENERLLVVYGPVYMEVGDPR